MGSVSPLRLPTIHFSDRNLDSCAKRDDVGRALEEFGCFEAVYDKVTQELHSATFGMLENLFILPLETKSKNISSKPYSGYIGNFPGHDIYEGLGIVDATRFEAIQNFTNLMWPEGKPKFSEILHSYVMKVSELEKLVKKMVMESLGVEKYYKSHAETISYDLRLLRYYKESMTDEAKLGLPSHTDKSFLTILHQNQVSGLEVQTKNGEWIRVTPSPSSFVVMVGDAFHAWTNGRLHCPKHRVIIEGKEARYSIGLFSFSSESVECPEVFIDEEHPLLFKPFDQLGLLGFYWTEEGRKAESTLKAYCGV